MKEIAIKILDIIGGISIVVFFFSLILKLWIKEEYQEILSKIIYTSFLAFAFVFIFYGFVFYEGDEK